MLPRLCLCFTLLGVTAVLPAAQNFRLGVNYSELIPTGSLTTSYGALAATDAQGAVYVLEIGLAGSPAAVSYYLTKLAQNRIVYQNLLPFAPLNMAVDPAGNVYLTTYSTNNQGVVKVGADGATVAYTTNMGPGVNLAGLAVDAAGRAYVAGSTQGNGIQTTPGALQSTPASTASTASNGFAIRLKPSGAVDYATYLGGSSQTQPASIAVDAAGSAFVTGLALSADFPTTAGAYLAGSGIPNFRNAPFLARLSPDGSALLYSTFAAGSGYAPYYVALDSSDDAVVALRTPGTASLVERFNPQGTAVAFSKMLPASPPAGLAVDAAGNTYFAVIANGNYPPMNSLATCETAPSAALSVLDGNGTVLQSTYIPGSSASQAFALGPDSAVYLVAVPDASFAPTQQLTGSSGGFLSLTKLSQNPGAPVVQLACAGNAASYDSAGISGGEIVSLFGQGLGPANGTQPRVDPHVGVPNQLAGVQVTFNDMPGPLLYVQDAQINAISPWALQAGETVKVCVVYDGAPTNCLTRPVVNQHPGVFTLDGLYAAALNQDGSFNTASNPAQIGDTVSIFATGLGPADPPQSDGAIVGFPLPVNVLQDQVYWLYDTFFIGTIAISTPVSYGGPAPFEVAGVSQVNFVVEDTSQRYSGQVPFVLQAGGPMDVGVVFASGSNGFLVHIAGILYPTASNFR